MAVTFLLVLPFVQVIVRFLGVGVATGEGDAVGVGVGVTTTDSGAFCVSLAEIVGDEYVKPFAERLSHPADSLTVCVATCIEPSSATMEILPCIGLSVNP